MCFEVDDFYDTVGRATELDVEVIVPPRRRTHDGEPGGQVHHERGSVTRTVTSS